MSKKNYIAVYGGLINGGKEIGFGMEGIKVMESGFRASEFNLYMGEAGMLSFNEAMEGLLEEERTRLETNEIGEEMPSVDNLHLEVEEIENDESSRMVLQREREINRRRLLVERGEMSVLEFFDYIANDV